MVPPRIPGRPAVPLPKKLFLQLDNSAKDNKNRYVMTFYSFLIVRRIFKEVTIGFLVVGHTHEDIDAHFSYLSKLLKMKNTYVLPDLMKAFMDSQKMTTFILELVQEVADFKKFLHGYEHDSANKLIGLREMHLFKFYVEENGAIWVGQLCVTRFVFKLCILEAFISSMAAFLSKLIWLGFCCGCWQSVDTLLSSMESPIFASRNELQISRGYLLARQCECGMRRLMILLSYRRVFMLLSHFGLSGKTLLLTIQSGISRRSLYGQASV